MGCDIHTCLEQRTTHKGKDKWVSKELYTKNDYYNPEEELSIFNSECDFGVAHA